MLTHTTLLSREVRRRKHFKKLAKKYHIRINQLQQQVDALSTELCAMSHEVKRMTEKANMTDSRIQQEAARMTNEEMASYKIRDRYIILGKLDKANQRIRDLENILNNEDWKVIKPAAPPIQDAQSIALTAAEAAYISAKLATLDKLTKFHDSITNIVKEFAK